MKNKLSLLIVLSMLLFLVLGCGAAREITKAIDKNAEPKIVKSKENKFQLKVPASWSKSMELHEEATLGASLPIRELYTCNTHKYGKHYRKLNFDRDYFIEDKWI